MKRICSLLLCLALLLTLSGLVLAEGEDSSNPGSSDSSEAPGKFEFKIISMSQTASKLTVKWNQAEAGASVIVIGMKIDGTEFTATPQSDDTFTIDLDRLRVGLYDTVQVIVREGTKQETVELTLVDDICKGGDLTLKFDNLVRNASGKVVATLKDEYGRPVSGYPVKMEIGNIIEDGKQHITDAKGQVTSNTPIENTDEAKKTVLCIAENSSNTINGITIRYLGTQKGFFDGFTVPPVTTTSPPTSGDTSSNPTTGDSTTTSPVITTGSKDPISSSTNTQPDANVTYPTILGAGTTAMVDNRVAVNLSMDSGVLTAFGLTQNDFATKGRMLLSPEAYQSLVTSNGTLMLNLRSSNTVISEALVQGALSGNSDFSAYPSDRRKVVAFDLSLLTQSDGSYVDLTDSKVTVEIQLPIPASMKNSDKMAITIYDGGSLVKPMQVDIKDGTVTFQTNNMGTFVLMGFLGESGKGAPVSVLVIVLLVVGVLLLVGAGLLLYFFVIRKPKDDEEMEEFSEEDETDGMEEDATEFVRLDDELQDYDPNSRDIYSGRDDMPRRQNPPRPYDQDRDR